MGEYKTFSFFLLIKANTWATHRFPLFFAPNIAMPPPNRLGSGNHRRIDSPDG
jgi:hypothetical protein